MDKYEACTEADHEIQFSATLATYSVRRQGFGNQWRLKLRERLAHLVGLITRRVQCDASVAIRVFFV
jgi:hypothetical protein